MKNPKAWKPTYGCTFFFVAPESLFSMTIRIKQDIWKAEPFQLELSNVGNCFRTREEASEIAERLILATERELLGNSREAQDPDEKTAKIEPFPVYSAKKSQNSFDANTIIEQRKNSGRGDFRKLCAMKRGFVDSFNANTLSPRIMSAVEVEALDMILTKIARIATGTKPDLDSWQDIAGYATLVVNDFSQEETDFEQQEQEARPMDISKMETPTMNNEI